MFGGAFQKCLLPQLFQSFLQPLAQRLDHLESRVALIVRFDQGPRGIFRARATDHLVDAAFVFVPLFAVAPIFIRKFLALIRRRLSLLKPRGLLILVDVQPELEQ